MALKQNDACNARLACDFCACGLLQHGVSPLSTLRRTEHLPFATSRWVVQPLSHQQAHLQQRPRRLWLPRLPLRLPVWSLRLTLLRLLSLPRLRLRLLLLRLPRLPRLRRLLPLWRMRRRLCPYRLRRLRSVLCLRLRLYQPLRRLPQRREAPAQPPPRRQHSRGWWPQRPCL
jgi:hypothetical protein